MSFPCNTSSTNEQKPSSLFHLYLTIPAYVPVKSFHLFVTVYDVPCLFTFGVSLRHAQAARPSKPKPPAGPPSSPQTQTNMINHMLKGMAKQTPSTVIVFLPFIQCFPSLAVACLVLSSCLFSVRELVLVCSFTKHLARRGRFLEI